MPVPVSRTVSRARPGARRRLTETSPRNVCLSALEIRLSTICSHISRATKMGSPSGGQSTSSRSPARAAMGTKARAISAVSAARLVGSNSTASGPTSARAKSISVVT